MMKVRACLGVSAIGLLAACSAGGGAPPQGAWKCESEVQGMKQALDMTYGADGKTSGKAHVVADQPGMSLDVSVDFQGAWKLEGDQLTEQMTGSKITTGTLNGDPMPEELKAAMVQGMSQPQTSTMKVEGGVMTLSNPDTTVTCKK